MFSRIPVFVLVFALASAVLQGEDWPQFRGATRDNVSRKPACSEAGPPAARRSSGRSPWRRLRGRGHQGRPALPQRLQPEKKEHWVRCLSMADGKDLWGWSYPVEIRPNHGITRTVPAVGRSSCFRWTPRPLSRARREDRQAGLAEEPGAGIQGHHPGMVRRPESAARRRPLIIATGGDALVVALDQATGKEIWRSPNPAKDVMSHASLMPATIGGVKQYLYLTMNSVVGVAAADGQLLWSSPFAVKMAAAVVARLHRRRPGVRHQRLRGRQRDVPGGEGRRAASRRRSCTS